MELPEDVLKKGRITVYKDTPFELVKAAEEYNRYLEECRRKSRFVEEIEFGYLVMNLILVLCLTALFADSVVENPLVSVPIILLNIFAYIYFSVIRRNFLFSTICTALFVIINLLFFILLTADLIFCFMHRHITEELKKEPAYPAFAELQIHYDRRSTPTEQYNDIWGNE